MNKDIIMATLSGYKALAGLKPKYGTLTSAQVIPKLQTPRRPHPLSESPECSPKPVNLHMFHDFYIVAAAKVHDTFITIYLLSKLCKQTIYGQKSSNFN